jgi:hypothetical protein
MSPHRMIVLVSLLAMPPIAATTALAHHGWSWTADGMFQLEGRVTSVYFGNPHPALDVDVEGESWVVELAPPRQSARRGITEETVQVGAEITALGNRSRDDAERRMKAVRLTVGGETFEVYPGRATN